MQQRVFRSAKPKVFIKWPFSEKIFCYLEQSKCLDKVVVYSLA